MDISDLILMALDAADLPALEPDRPSSTNIVRARKLARQFLFVAANIIVVVATLGLIDAVCRWLGFESP